MRRKNKRDLGTQIAVIKEIRPGVFENQAGRLFNQEGLNAMKANGMVIFMVVGKTPIQTGDASELRGHA